MLQPPEKFSSDVFVQKELMQNLECRICKNMVSDPVQCHKGHVFCRGCLAEWMKRKKQCPTCSVVISAESIGSVLSAKNMMDDADVYCFTRLEALIGGNDSDSGSHTSDVEEDEEAAAGNMRKRVKADHCCTWTGKLQNAQRHFNECLYAGVMCGFGCGAVVLRKDVPEHEASNLSETRSEMYQSILHGGDARTFDSCSQSQRLSLANCGMSLFECGLQ